MLDQEARALLDLMEQAVQAGRPQPETLPYAVGRLAVDKMSGERGARPPAVRTADHGGVACKICRDAGPAFEMLIYPATDSSRESTSRKEFAEGYFLTKPLMDWFWKAYVPAGTDLADLRLSPLLAKNFAGLPPAFVLTAGYDPPRDEGRASTHRPIHARITTTSFKSPHTIHSPFSPPPL